jgi:hypothetical protein
VQLKRALCISSTHCISSTANVEADASYSLCYRGSISAVVFRWAVSVLVLSNKK